MPDEKTEIYHIKEIPGDVSGISLFLLFRSKDAVTGIAESRADVGGLVQLPVQMPDIDLYVRVGLRETLNAFRCGDDKHAFDCFAAVFFDKVHCGYRRASCSEHGIDNHDLALFNGHRELAVVFMRLVSLRIAVKPDMPDLS